MEAWRGQSAKGPLTKIVIIFFSCYPWGCMCGIKKKSFLGFLASVKAVSDYQNNSGNSFLRQTLSNSHIEIVTSLYQQRSTLQISKMKGTYCVIERGGNIQVCFQIIRLQMQSLSFCFCFVITMMKTKTMECWQFA